MTSELLTMNKAAIALAADSAVTINGKKVRMGVEKLFKLSNDPPMGMMIFGNANFENIPMETLIKKYSKEHDFKMLNNIENIKENFLKYLGDVTPSFDFKRLIEVNLSDYIADLGEEIKNMTKMEFEKFIHNFEIDDSLDFVQDLVEFKRMDSQFEDILPDFILDDEKKDIMFVLKMNFFMGFLSSTTGVVIAGFSEEDLFPSFVSFDLIVNNDGKIEVKSFESKINYSFGYIVPFAQRDVIDTFLTGSNIWVKEVISVYMLQFIDNYCKLIEDAISSNENIDESSKMEFIREINHIKSIKSVAVDNFDNFFEKWEDIIMTPILSAINTLPKNELAELTYSLVNITSLRRKIDSDIESVGGKVAVAIITKGDGFVWLNKVNNVDINLNPHIINRS